MGYEITEDKITQIQKLTFFAIKALVMYKKDQTFKKLVDSCGLEVSPPSDKMNLPELIKTLSEIAVEEEVVLGKIVTRHLEHMKPLRAEIKECIETLISNCHNNKK